MRCVKMTEKYWLWYCALCLRSVKEWQPEEPTEVDRLINFYKNYDGEEEKTKRKTKTNNR